MKSNIDITQLSKEEKLQVMEAIWEDLTREEDSIPSPQWHAEVLQETEGRVKTGQEEILDWEKAQSDLRNRLE